jgi:DNA repair exonuclease SbcCD ATPase subunit
MNACEYDLWNKEKDSTKWAEIQKFRAHLWSPTSRGRTYTNYLAPTEEYLDWRNQVSVCLPAEGTPRLPRKVKMPKDYVEDYLKEKDEYIGQLEDDIEKLKKEKGQMPDLQAEIERLMLENSTLRQECKQKEVENETWRRRCMTSETKQKRIMLSKRHMERDLGACRAQLKCREHTLAGYRRRVKDIEEQFTVCRAQLAEKINEVRACEAKLAKIERYFAKQQHEDQKKYNALSQMYNELLEKCQSSTKEVQEKTLELQDKVRECNAMKAHIDFTEAEGLELLSTIEEVNLALHAVTEAVCPFIPAPLHQELKNSRAKLIPYARMIKEYGKRDVMANSSGSKM